MFNSAFLFVVIFSLTGLGFYLVLVYLFPALNRIKVGSKGMPESWEKVLNSQIEEFPSLPTIEKEKVRKIVKVYMAEKYLEPDSLKWDEQILICGTIAIQVYKVRGLYLNKLSTIRIGKKENFGQGVLEIQSIPDLKKIDYSKWF